MSHALKLWREQGDDSKVAQTLMDLSDANWLMGLSKEAIQQSEEALEIYGRLGGTLKQAECLDSLAASLCSDGQLDAAEEAAFRAIALLPDEGEEHRVGQCHQTLANIYEKLGDAKRLEGCTKFLQKTENDLVASCQSAWNCELL